MNILEILRIYILPVIDILAVAYLIYKTYTIVVETRAYIALRGLIVILLIYILSNILKLQTLNLILKFIISYGVIAFIIVFQPEIRRILVRMGENKILSLGTKPEFHPVNEIVQAVLFMAKKKRGALIVLKNKMPLKNIEATGIKMDAVVSTELIISIFFKNNPLHDGAIIIEGDRITAASCYLPLSEASLSKQFGTRHRAALGLSENSDAIVIVVSEETGKIALAYKGNLKTNYNEDSLKNELNKIMAEKWKIS